MSQGREKGKEKGMGRIVRIAFAGTVVAAMLSPVFTPKSNVSAESSGQGSSRSQGLEKAQRAKRIHGGPKVAGPQGVNENSASAVAGAPTNNRRGAARQGGKSRQEAIVQSDRVHTQENNGPFFNGSLSQQQAMMGIQGPVYSFEKDKKEKENTELIGVQNLIGMMASIAPQQATMLGEALKMANNLTDEKARSQLIDGIQIQATEILTSAVLENADSPQITNILKGDPTGIPFIDSFLSKFSKEVKQEALSISELVTESIANLGGKITPDFLSELSRSLLSLGLTPLALIAIQHNLPTIVEEVNKVGGKKLNPRLVLSIVNIVMTVVLVSCSAGAALTATPPPATATSGEAPTAIISSPTVAPDIIITPSPGAQQIPSEIQGVNYYSDPTVGIPSPIFRQNNPEYELLYPGQTPSLSLKEYMDPTGVIGTRISEKDLMEIFGLSPDKATGNFNGSWNGMPIAFDPKLKALVDENGKKIFPFVSPNGTRFASLFQDKNGNLFFGLTNADGSYKILESYKLLGSDANLTDSLHKFIKEQLNRGNTLEQSTINKVASFEFSGRTMILYDANGQAIAYIDYLGKGSTFVLGAPSGLPTEIATEAPVTVSEEYRVLQTLLDTQKVPYTIVDGKIVIDDYTTQTSDNLVLNPESGELTKTTDLNHSDILSIQDEKMNLYLFNPDHGWFRPVTNIENEDGTEADGNDLNKYTEIGVDYITDGRLDIMRAYKYSKSPNGIMIDVDPVFWITSGYGDSILRLSFFPVGKTGEASYYYNEEYEKSNMFDYKKNKAFQLAGYYKVKLENGEYIYVINRTIAIDRTHTIGLANGFDSKEFERRYSNVLPTSETELKLSLDGIKKGGLDIASILTPPETFEDGSLVFFAQQGVIGFNPNISSLQGPRGYAISLFSHEDQIRFLSVLEANKMISEDGKNRLAAPLIDPSALARLSNMIMLSEINNP